MTDRIRAAQRHAAKLDEEMGRHRRAGTKPGPGLCQSAGDALARVRVMVRDWLRETEADRKAAGELR
jgi:hypothetical protein